jgi:NADH-quinone oxidoreductase subunit H
MAFGYFFLSEYVSIWTVCILNVIIFLGGYFFIFDYTNLIYFIWKIILLLMIFVWVRGSLPRYRYDQLMRLGWKVLLPIALGAVFLYGSYFYKQIINIII